MPKFAFEKIKVIAGGKFSVFQLSIDGVKQLDKFERELEGTPYLSQYKILLTWIDYYSNTGNIPEKK